MSGADVSQPGSRQAIHYSTVLVVEGRDMFGFFFALLKDLGLDKQIEVRNGGGTQDLYDYLAVLPNISGFDKVISLGIACDTETDPHAAFRNLCLALQQAALPVPSAALRPTTSPPAPRVTIALLPDAQAPGMLETLIWRSLTGDPRLVCVEQYLDCIRQQTGQPLLHEEKSRIHAYIAGREQPWLLLGQAAHARYFPWTSPVFNEMKTFVQVLVATTP